MKIFEKSKLIPNQSTALRLACILGVTALLQGCIAMVAGGAATGAALMHDRRTSGTIVDDQTIEMRAYKAIADIKPKGADSHITAISYNNALLLVGQVPNENLKYAIVSECQKLQKVKQVYNEMTVEAPTTMKVRANDAFITSKVKGEYLVQAKVDASRIKVVTEDSVVYLMGLVNRDEESAAVEIARDVKGVQKVVKVFEYY